MKYLKRQLRKKSHNINGISGMSFFDKLAYGLGAPPISMVSNTTALFLPIFLLETAKINPFYLSAIQIIGRISDAITDPIIGYFVNRTNSRFGKFKPWIFCATPFSCIIFMCLFYVPNINNEAAKFSIYCIIIILVQIGFTAYYVPYSSMCMVLTSNSQVRDQLISIKTAFEFVGILVGICLFGFLATRNRIANKSLNSTITISMINLEKSDYLIGAGAVCAVFIVCAIILLFGSKEQNTLEEKIEPYLLNLKKILRFKPYLILMFAYMFSSLGIQVIQGNFAIYITHVLKLPNEVVSSMLMLLSCSLVLLPVGHKLCRKFGKKTIFIIGNINIIPILVLLAFLPENINLFLFYGYMFWTSFSIMTNLVVPWLILPEVIDQYFTENGSRMEATFYSFFVFFNKLAVGISLFLSGIALGLSGYDSNMRNHPMSVSIGLRYYMSTAAIICYIISLVIVSFYRKSEPRLKENELNQIQ